MTADASPPARTTHNWRTLGGSWSYDSWGGHGRPVILLHAILFDRAMWWPVAAELRTDAPVIAVDLPGHGTSPARARYDPHQLIEELALLVHSLGVAQAPIVVGHGTSAGLAGLFAARPVLRPRRRHSGRRRRSGWPRAVRARRRRWVSGDHGDR